MLSGATGQLYGNHYTWTFESGWQQNLNTPGIRQLQYMKDFFSARQWSGPGTRSNAYRCHCWVWNLRGQRQPQ